PLRPGMRCPSCEPRPGLLGLLRSSGFLLRCSAIVGLLVSEVRNGMAVLLQCLFRSPNVALRGPTHRRRALPARLARAPMGLLHVPGPRTRFCTHGSMPEDVRELSSLATRRRARSPRQQIATCEGRTSDSGSGLNVGTSHDGRRCATMSDHTPSCRLVE